MAKQGSKKARKRFVLITIIFLVLLTLSFVSLFQDWLKIASNKQELAYLEDYYTSLLEEEESLNSEVTKLHDMDYIARYARERYMYSLPGEIIIKIPNSD